MISYTCIYMSFISYISYLCCSIYIAQLERIKFTLNTLECKTPSWLFNKKKQQANCFIGSWATLSVSFNGVFHYHVMYCKAFLQETPSYSVAQVHITPSSWTCEPVGPASCRIASKCTPLSLSYYCRLLIIGSHHMSHGLRNLFQGVVMGHTAQQRALRL